ncbi:MAG: AAA family ATPase [Gemmatimonadetes bacterium]|nr:AAA family ATPase [Gemmatimonadota bacterium]
MAIAGGVDLPRPVPPIEEPEEPDERAEQVEALRERLLAGIPEERAARSAEQQARWILAYLLDWHRREDKATWWEYFRLRDLPEDELVDEPQAVAGLAFVARVGQKLSKKGKPTGTVTDRYAWPPQEMEIRAGGELKLKEGTWGKVVTVDRVRRTIDVEVGPSKVDLRPASAFEHKWVDPGILTDAVLEIGERVAASGDLVSADLGAAGDLLLGRAPRLKSRGGAPVLFDGSNADVRMAERVAITLDRSTLAVQGPPGAGKTYTGARMICALVKAGKQVGVTANSHKAIRNLLEAVHEAAVELRLDVRIAHRVSAEDASDASSAIREVTDNKEGAALLHEQAIDVMGATSWFWARPELAHAVDVIFVDEAGQMALANTVVVSRAAASLVLLGDPQQLNQPTKGSHPDGVGNSALHHVLGEHSVISPDVGLFLPVTWRLAPKVCAFTSEMYYEGQLRSKDTLEAQVLAGCGVFDGSGVRVVEVAHEGNRGYADAEVDVVEQLVRQLTAAGATWTNAKGNARSLLVPTSSWWQPTMRR